MGIQQDSSSFPGFETGQINVVHQEIDGEFNKLFIGWNLVV
jgi:hypothetical protein